jgi:Zn-finger nucleic acid-binding protein
MSCDDQTCEVKASVFSPVVHGIHVHVHADAYFCPKCHSSYMDDEQMNILIKKANEKYERSVLYRAEHDKDA